MSDEQLEEYRQMMVRLSTQRVIEPSDIDDLLDAVALLIAEVKGQTRRAEAAEAPSGGAAVSEHSTERHTETPRG